MCSGERPLRSLYVMVILTQLLVRRLFSNFNIRINKISPTYPANHFVKLTQHPFLFVRIGPPIVPSPKRAMVRTPYILIPRGIKVLSMSWHRRICPGALTSKSRRIRCNPNARSSTVREAIMFSFVWLDIVSIKWILAECPFYGFIPHHNRLGSHSPNRSPPVNNR